MSGSKETGNGRRPTRVALTPSPAKARLLRQAAATAGKPVEDFVLESACAAAYRLLMEKPDFLMDDPDWEHFLGLLDQPKSEMDRLKDLLS